MKKVVIPLIFWGTIMFSLTLVFGMDTITFISKVNINDSYFLYKIDTFGYLQNLKNSFGTITELTIETPTRIWNDDIINNLALMLDWFLFGLNVFIYMFRIGGYSLLQILAIFGVNTVDNLKAGGLNWLVILGKFLRDLAIPYV